MKKIGVLLLLVVLTCSMWAAVNQSSGSDKGGLRDLSIIPSSVYFSNQQIYTQGQRSIQLQNTNANDMQVFSISISGNDYFSLSGLPDFTATLAPSEFLDFQVLYYPTTTTTVAGHDATITITTSSEQAGQSQEQHTVSVSGSAVDHRILSLPFMESFDNTATGGLPDGWSKYEGSNNSVSVISGSTASAPNCVKLDMADNQYHPILIMRPLGPDFNVNQLRITFSAIVNNVRGVALLDLGVMTDPTDPNSFELLETFDTSMEWQSYYYDFSSYSGNARHIAFRNSYGFMSGQSIDDIRLAYLPSSDMAIVGIDVPSLVSLYSSTPIIVTVKNCGQFAQSYYTVNLYHTAMAGGPPLDSITGPTLTPGQSQQVTFNWTPSQAGAHDLYAVVESADDQYAANNTSDTRGTCVVAGDFDYTEVGPGETTDNIPLSFVHSFSLNQCLYLQSEVGRYGKITHLALFNDFVYEIADKPVKVWMGKTTLTDLQYQLVPVANMTLVFEGNLSFPADNNTIVIDLDTDFEYDQDNLVIMYQRTYDTQTYDNWYNTFRGDSQPYRTRYNRAFYSQIDPADFQINNSSSADFLPQTGFCFERSYTMQVTPTTLDFGNVVVGRSQYGSVNVANTGTGSISITGVQFDSGENFEFTYPTLPIPLAPGTNVNLSMFFTPDEVGPFSDTMMIITDYSEESVTVLGQGVNEPLTAEPSPVSFGNNLPIGITSTVNLNLTHNQNSGFDNVTITGISINGDSEFSLGSFTHQQSAVTLPYPLPEGGTLVVPVKFLPLAPVEKNAMIVVSFSEGTSMRINVSAFNAAVPEIEVSPKTIFHVVEPIGGGEGVISIHNSGNAELSFSINTDDFYGIAEFYDYSNIVAGNSSEEVSYMILDSQSQGLHTYNLQITSNDPTNPTVNIPFAYQVAPPSDTQGFFAYPTQGDLPLHVQFRLAPQIEGLRYSWDFENNGSFDSFEREPLHTYTTAGVYSVRLVVMLPTGATRQYLMQNYISVGYAGPTLVDNPLSAVEFDQGWNGGPYSLTEVFAAPAGAVLQYGLQGSEHISGDVNEWGVFLLYPAYNWYGIETITVSATDQYGNSISHQITVTVNHVNQAPILMIPRDLHFIHRSSLTVDFSQYISDPDNDTDQLGITLSRVSGDETIQFVYSPGGQPNVPGQHTVIFSSTLEIPQTTRFNIEVTDFVRRATSSIEFNVHVLDHFEPDMYTDDYYQFTGQSVQFIDATFGNHNSWVWDFGDDTPVSNERNPVHIYQYGGTYSVTLTVKHLYADNTVNEEATTTFTNFITMQGTGVTPDNMPAEDDWGIDGSPYNLFGGVTFDEDYAPEIDEGVEVNIFGEQPLTIGGGFTANNVTFAGPQAGGWTGLSFEGDGRNVSTLTNCRIMDAAEPIKIVGASPNLSGITIGTTASRNLRNAQRAVFIGQNSSALIDSLKIDGYPQGIVIDNDGSLRATPTLTHIRVRNSTQTSRNGALTGTGLTLSGSANINDAEIGGFDTGINVQNNSTAATPTLTHIRVRNSTQTSRDSTAARGTTGAKVSGDVNINDMDVAGYNTGVQVNGTRTSNATPTLTHIRVRNSTQTSREVGDSNALGLYIGEFAAPEIDTLIITDLPRGIHIEAGDNATRATPTLTHIRVRNSTQTSRAGTLGLAISNTQNVGISDATVEGYNQGVQINSTSASVSTPTLTHIRVRNSTQTSRSTGVGVDIWGNVEANIDSLEITNYDLGFRYQGIPETRAISTPTLTHIRVRNSTQTSRNETYGMQLIDLDRVNLTQVDIEDYQYGLEVNNTQSYRAISTPTLTHIRVRNSTQTSRFENYGILLGNNVSGIIKDSKVEEAKIGLVIADGNNTTLQPLKIFNCGIGIKAISLNRPMTIQGHYIINEEDFISEHPYWDYVGFDLMGAGPWKIKNNTLVGMNTYLNAMDAQGEFVNNIAIGNPAAEYPFNLYNSNFSANYNNMFVASQNPGVSNFSLDPVFTNPSERDYTITYDSPCIDAGSPNEPLDADGTVSDVGAYTYLHKAVIQSSHRFITPGNSVSFSNVGSIGHNTPDSNVLWYLFKDDTLYSECGEASWNYTFTEVGTYDVRLTMHSGNLTDICDQPSFIVVQNHLLSAPTGVALTRDADNNFQISWDAVTTMVDQTPIVVPHYLVYASDDPDGTFSFLGYTSDGECSFTDYQQLPLSRRFYIVIGFAGTLRELQDYIEGNRSMTPGGASPSVPIRLLNRTDANKE